MKVTKIKSGALIIAVFVCLCGVQANPKVQQSSSIHSAIPQSNEDGEKIYTTKEVTQKAIIRKYPTPSYTKKAKKNNVEGTVKLKVVLASNGKVTNIELISGLPDGLTEKAVESAKKIKFDPATINMRPVSQWLHLEYVFNLY